MEDGLGLLAPVPSRNESSLLVLPLRHRRHCHPTPTDVATSFVVSCLLTCLFACLFVLLVGWLAGWWVGWWVGSGAAG